MSLSSCLKKTKGLFSSAEQVNLIALAAKRAEGGMSLEQAEKSVVDEALADANAEYQEIVTAIFEEDESLSQRYSAFGLAAVATPKSEANAPEAGAAVADTNNEEKPNKNNDINSGPTVEMPDMKPWKMDFGIMGEYEYRPLNRAPVPEGGKLIDAETLPFIIKLTKSYSDAANLPRNIYGFRVSLVEKANGERYTQAEYVEQDTRQPGGFIGATFAPLRSLVEERPFSRVSAVALKMWEKYQSNKNQGGLFEQPKQAYNPNQQAFDFDRVYDSIETRPGTTDVQRRLGIAALRGLFAGDRRAGATVLGSALWKDFTERAGAELVGQRVQSADDLALAAQILRDPRFETLRVFFVKDGKIVGHTGWTTRMPGSVTFGNNSDGFQGQIDRLNGQRQALDADGYYLMHNHPSGRATPSNADELLTRSVNTAMPGFKGHVVIDHNEYAVIDKNGQSVIELTPEITQKAAPEVAHDVLGLPLSSPTELVTVAKMLTNGRPGYATLVTTAGSGRVQAIAEVPESMLARGTKVQELRAIARIRRFHNGTGSHGQIFIVANDPGRFDWLIRRGVLTDAVDPTPSRTGVRSMPRSGNGVLIGTARYRPNKSVIGVEQGVGNYKPELIVQHNLTAENLMHAIRMGGLPVPSLAITKAQNSNTSYGEITLIGPKELADPKGYASPKVYGADIYSPRYPAINYLLDRASLAKLNDLLAPYRKDGEREIYSGEIENPRDMRGNNAFDRYVDEQFKDEKTGYRDSEAAAAKLLREAGAKERIFKGYTNNGTRYVPHTLENVVRILKKDLRGGESSSNIYGIGQLRSKFTPQFRSVKQIRDNKDRIVGDEEFEKIKEEINQEFFSIADRIESSREKKFGFADTVIAVMEDASRMGVDRALSEYDLSATDETKSDIRAFLAKLKNLPTEYFEAKILGSVGIQEFSAAVVPDATKQDVIDAIERRGIEVAKYKRGDDKDRRRVVAELAASLGDKALFSRNRQGGMSVYDLQAVVTRVEKSLTNAPRINVLETPNQAPKDLVNYMRKQGAMGNVEGAFYNGEIYAFASNIKDEFRAEHVIFTHELTHYGMRGVFGKQRDAILNGLYVRNPALRQRAMEVRKQFGLESNVDAVEEVLAEMKDSELVQLKGIDRLIAMVRDWLAKNGFNKLAERLDGMMSASDQVKQDAILGDIVRAAREFSRNGKPDTRTHMYMSGVALSDDAQEGPVWYSQLARVVDGAKQNVAPAQMWKSWLKNQPGVKADEIEATGVNDWLDMQGAKVTKAQLQDYLAQNGVKVEEVEIGKSRQYTAVKFGDVQNKDAVPGNSYADADEWVVFMDGKPVYVTGADNAQRAIEFYLQDDAAAEVENDGFTKYSQYQLPGGENYRELLLTLPTNDVRTVPVKLEWEQQTDNLISARLPSGNDVTIFSSDDGASAELQVLTPDAVDVGNPQQFASVAEAKAAAETMAVEKKQNITGGFRSSHFDQPNILAHIRFNERTDAEGKKVLFIEEIQSDWAQKGKKEGFNDGALKGEVREQQDGDWAVHWPDGTYSGGFSRAGAERVAIMGKKGSAVPAAPFVGKTEAWVSLSLKRMIRYAAENGFDRVAWTTGEQQAARYDLSKQVRRIEWNGSRDGTRTVTISPNAGNDIEFRVLSDGKTESMSGGISGNEFTGKRLDEVVGKEVADKIMADRDGSLSGNGLSVGGEGMKAFYDKIVPNIANDVLKKMGGGRVGVVSMEKPSNAIKIVEQGAEAIDRRNVAATAVEQSGFDITPALRRKAIVGLPMFSRAPSGSIADAVDTIKSSARPEWITQGSDGLKSAASKIDTYAPQQTVSEKFKEMTVDWKKRLVQGMVDAYAPLKDLDYKSYMLARMTKSADGALEGMLAYGKPVMDADGAIVGDLDGKGFLGAMQELKGEHDRFFMWIAGNRAGRLSGEGRENLFTPAEIDAMKELNQGRMADGSPRAAAYAKAAQTFKEYNTAVMDIAEKTGLIDGDARHLWEHDFYVPFYRVMEDDKISGPSKIKGLVRQRAFQKLKGGQENLGDLMANTLQNWSHMLSASLANQAAASSLAAAEKAGVATQVPSDTKGATFAMVNGKPVHYEVSDPFVLDAISAMDSASFKGLPMKLMQNFKRYLTIGVTASPTFRIRNLMRDTISAIGQNDVSFNAMKNLTEGFKGTDKKSDVYAQMLFGGGVMRFGTSLEGDRAEHVKRLIDAGVDDNTVLTTRKKVKAALGKVWDAWQDIGDRMENVNRSALYQQFIARGMSHQEAAFAARDMLDFSMQGSWTAVRMLTQVVPFMNARMQGLYKLGRAAKNDPQRMAYVAGAVSLASIALLLAYQDDDDWKKREDWDRDAFWWFKIGDVAFRIPKPFEIGAMGTLAERSVELMISDEMTGKRFAGRLGSMLGDTFSLNPVPQLFKPMIDIYANEDSFTDRPIEGKGMERLSKSERYNASTSLVARALGAAGDITGLSPVQIDHIIRGYFGWLGSHATMTVDLMAEPFSDNTKPSRRVGEMFVIGDFVKSLPQDQSRYVEEFYKQSKKVQEVMADIKRARESGQAEKAAEMLTDNRDKIALYRVYSHAEKQMEDINKQIRLTQYRNLPSDDKRARLDQLMAARNNLARVVSERAAASRLSQ